MKKLISLLLCLLLISGTLCACSKDKDNNKESDTTAPAEKEPLSAEEVVQIYMDNMDVWKYSGDTSTTPGTSDISEWYGYLFLDLNFDGVLELIKCANTQDDHVSHNNYYSVNTEDKTVYEIPFPNIDKENQCDFTGTDYPNLYKNNSTGEFRYMTSNYFTAKNGINNATVIGELYMDKNGNLNANNLWSLDLSFEDDDYQNVTIIYSLYDENGTKSSVEEETYLKTLEEYENENTNMNLQFKTVLGYGDIYCEYNKFTELDTEGQYNLLLESYKAFKY